MALAISTNGLVKRFGRTTALAGLDLEVETGEVRDLARHVDWRWAPLRRRCRSNRSGLRGVRRDDRSAHRVLSGRGGPRRRKSRSGVHRASTRRHDRRAGQLDLIVLAPRLGSADRPVRPGPEQAPEWLGSPLTLSLRLQRTSIIWWTAALTLSGVLFGAWSDAMLTSIEDLPDVLLDLVGGPSDVVTGYLGIMALFMGLIVGIFAILAVQSLRAEETGGRGEPVLATPVSRVGWLGTHLAVSAVGIVVILAATGLGTGIGAAIVTGDASSVWEGTIAHVAYTPAVVLVLAVAALLFGAAPRLVPAAWVILGYALVVGLFGQLMNLPGWLSALSPFEHIGRVPFDPVKATPLVVLTVLAAAATAGGLTAFRRRGVNVT